MNSLTTNNEYGNWLKSLKEKIKFLRQWVQFYSSSNDYFAKQPVSQIETGHSIAKQAVSQLQITDNVFLNRFFQIPWGHHIQIIL